MGNWSLHFSRRPPPKLLLVPQTQNEGYAVAPPEQELVPNCYSVLKSDVCDVHSFVTHSFIAVCGLVASGVQKAALLEGKRPSAKIG